MEDAACGVNLKDYRSHDRQRRESFIKTLGESFVRFGYVNVTGCELSGTINSYYSMADSLFSSSDERLALFNLLKNGLERGYVPNPSGSPKPVEMHLNRYPRSLYVGGLSIRLAVKDGIKAIITSPHGEVLELRMPEEIYDRDKPDSQIKKEVFGRKLKFQKQSADSFLIYAPDNKRSWITGKAHNIYPAEHGAFAEASIDLYKAQTEIGLDVAHALARYLGDDTGKLLSRIVDSQGQNIASHSMRVYQYPRFTDKDLSTLTADDLIIRAGQHRDLSLFTLLVQANEAGLEVQDNLGTWRPAKIRENAVLIMAGDLLNWITKGLTDSGGQSLEIPSLVHRVIANRENVRTDRYSLPFFFNLDMLQGILSLHDGMPIRVQDPSEGLDIVLDPGLRLLHAHLRSSTNLSGADFSSFKNDYENLGKRMDECMKSPAAIRAIYTRER